MNWSTKEALFYKAVGHRIKSRRQSCELSQQDLANSVKLTRASVCNIEAGRTRVQVHTLVAFAEALMCRVSQLVP